MSIKVYYLQLEKSVPETFWQEQLNSFPTAIRTKILLYKYAHSRIARIAGKFLLRELLKANQLYPKIDLSELEYSENNQPQLKGTTFQFSISHSQNMVVCAGSFNQKIGIDTEFIQPLELELFENYFDEKSWQKILTSKNQGIAFYEKWTSKEAALKASGLGIEQVALKEIIQIENIQIIKGKNYYTKQLVIDEKYCSCIASDKKIEDVVIIRK